MNALCGLAFLEGPEAGWRPQQELTPLLRSGRCAPLAFGNHASVIVIAKEEKSRKQIGSVALRSTKPFSVALYMTHASRCANEH